MMSLRILFLLLLGTVGAGHSAAEGVRSATPSDKSVEITHAAASKMTTAQIVALLQPGQSADRFVAHKVGALGPHGEPLGLIRFFEQPQPHGYDLCLRRGVDVHLQPAGKWVPGGDSPVRLSRTSPGLQIAGAPGCRLRPGGVFASVRPADDADAAARALRRLIQFQADARRRTLPTGAVLCISEQLPNGERPNACDRPAGELLSSLALDQVEMFERDGHDWRFRLIANGPDPRQFWVATVGTDSARHPVVLEWVMPAPY